MKTVRNLAVLALCVAQCSCFDGLAFSLTPGGQMALTYTTPASPAPAAAATGATAAKAVVLSDKGSK